ncbi:ATP-binding protein [Lysobacter claricitrinus]|uniref:ATP-binding protein n=1 Tax=Lysobacter claricitrinus TaxID=3367728 RepID=UPI0037DB9EF9
MIVPISVRLFLMGLLSMTLVGLLALGLVRWSLADAPSPMPQRESQRVDALAASLSQQFEAHGDWRFLPADADARTAWLRSNVARSAGISAYAPGDEASTLAERIALIDANGRRLAGTEPAPALVAIASIDRRRLTIPAHGGVAGYLSVALPRNADDALTVAFLMRKQPSLAGLAALAFALAALASAVVAASFRKPLRALVDGARRLGDGEFDTRIDARRRDEFGELARSFNELGAQLDAAQASRRRWIADTSHELRTPLAVLQAQVEAMQDGVRPVTAEGLTAMAAQVAALGTLVNDLNQLARGDVGTLQLDLQRIDPWQVLAAEWARFEDRLRSRQLHPELIALSARRVATGDPVRLAQVLRNVLENCARYAATGGRVVLSGEVDASTLSVHIDDSAPGVADDARDRLGERFFRVDASRSREHGGSGLGLALSRQIVEAHGGRLTFDASPLGGLRVTIALPVDIA